MKRVIIGAVVAALIYFGIQTLMWVGGFHRDFYSYAAKQDTILSALSAHLPAEGMYMMPMADNQSPDFKTQQEQIEKTMTGNPWAMVFFHPEMAEFSPRTMILGFGYTLLGAFLAALILFMGKFPTFWSRFTVSMLFAVFALALGPMSTMNWWEFPWNFVKAQVLDLAIGWTLCSLWLGWFVKPRTE